MSTLETICKAFKKNNVPYAIVGGFAVALHGALRGTVDIDFITKISLNNFLKIEKSMKEIGFESRLPVSAKEVFNFRKEYIENRNLIAWSFYNPLNSIELIDIIITENLTGMKTINKNLKGEIIHVLSIQNLIEMKIRSGRPQDLEDVKALKELQNEKS